MFAIAITLLILDVKVPHPPLAPDGVHAVAWTNRALASALWIAGMWKSYVAYLLSFSVILVMWVNHHRIFTIVRRADQPFLFWNGLLPVRATHVPRRLRHGIRLGLGQHRTVSLVRGVLLISWFYAEGVDKS